MVKKAIISVVFISLLLSVSIVLNGTGLERSMPIATVDTGGKVVYAAEDGLYCTGIDSGKTTLLVKGTGISTPVFSGDGNAVAYKQGTSLFSYDFTTNKSVILLEGVDSCCPTKGSGFYASSKKAGIVLIDPKTAEKSTVIPPESNTSYLHLKLSPDSKYLAYDSVLSGIENQDNGGTWLYDTASKKALKIVKATKVTSTSLGTHASVGKWSPDSGKLLIWLMTQSASISADGVSPALYDVAGKKVIGLDTVALAYNENVSFANSKTFAMIAGSGREMFEGKNLSIFDLKNIKAKKALDLPGKAAATPFYSADGAELAFAASPAPKASDDYKTKLAAIFKRQIYMCADGKLSALTSDCAYRSEAPVFMANNRILFARLDAGGGESIWVMDSDGRNQKQLAAWKYSDPNDARATDFYGRIDWSLMFDVFDK